MVIESRYNYLYYINGKERFIVTARGIFVQDVSFEMFGDSENGPFL